jgi:Flp pilus assembly protein TadG
MTTTVLFGAPRRFRTANGGNVAVTFALALIPIMYALGAAVDYSRANDVKAAMQAAADSTALTAAKALGGGASASQLQQTASDWFTGVYGGRAVSNLQVTATNDSSSVTVTATGSVKTDFLGVMGLNQLNVSVTSQSTWGVTKLQVALVLDNTGSMAAYGKMPALQTASHQLLKQLQNAAQNPSDIQVAIIPFTTDVNVGKGNAGANWLKWSYTAINPFGAFMGGGSSTVTVSPSTWGGCVTDRDQNYDAANTAPNATNVATLFPADNPLWVVRHR